MSMKRNASEEKVSDELWTNERIVFVVCFVFIFYFFLFLNMSLSIRRCRVIHSVDFEAGKRRETVRDVVGSVDV